MNLILITTVLSMIHFTTGLETKIFALNMKDVRPYRVSVFKLFVQSKKYIYQQAVKRNPVCLRDVKRNGFMTTA
jgi:hypothetical protein